jgi:hypothetical protein
MSAPNEQQPDEALEKLPPRRPEVDPLLRTFVKLANDAGLEIGVTLQIAGATVTGTMIGGAKFFEAQAKQLREGLGADGATADAFDTLFGEFSKPYSEPDDGKSLPWYIHLKNAMVMTPGARGMPNPGMLWRGRLADVSGYALVSLTAG